MPKFKIDMVSRAADWDASVTVNAESRDQAERLARQCMLTPEVWLVLKPSDEPFKVLDRVKLKRDQPIVLFGKMTNVAIPAGTRGAFMDYSTDTHCVIELADHPHRGMRVIVELSNLERV